MAKSILSARASKAAKPSTPDGFPLWPHPSGRWCKKVRGKAHYFGKVATDPTGQAALEKWLEQKDELLAGRTPRVSGDGLTIRDLANQFLTAKQRQLDCHEITPRTFADYNLATDRIIAAFGKTRLVVDLAADDFGALRAELAKTLGPVALANVIQRIRTVFKFATDNGLIDKPIRYGTAFAKPSRSVMRKQRAKNGERMFEAAEIHALLDEAGLTMRAMILLAINGGLGNNDVASLPISALDLDSGWLDFPRPKTGIQRRIPLWVETVEAIQAALDARPAPKVPEAEGLAFVTKYGQPWAKGGLDNPVAKEFAKLVRKLRLQRDGRGFYSLRHTFRTVADATRDFPALDVVMGHTDESMAARYREHIDDSRLEAVTDHVHAWLFGAA